MAGKRTTLREMAGLAWLAAACATAAAPMAALVSLLAACGIAVAQDRPERGPGPERHGTPYGQRDGHREGGRPGGARPRDPGWHGDIRHFRDRDLQRWHGGRWYHGAHGGRRGWWWIVGPAWYFYPAPVYPYPDPYLPSPAPAIVPPPPPGVAPQYWFYCADPPGYYPYVAWCRVDWRPVPARPLP